MMINLSKRQQTLVDVSKKSAVTADIGCDHGYIGVSLLINKKTKYLIASDISFLSAQKTTNLLSKENLEKQASVRVGDGLKTIKNNEKLNQIIIAGMGGLEICNILDDFKNKKNVSHYVFQPMNELVSFRNYLSNNNFEILKDFIIYDKQKYYHIITAKNGSQHLSSYQQKWGAKPKQRTKEYFDWILQKEKKLIEISKKIPKNNEKYLIFDKCLKEINKIKNTKGAKIC